MTFAEWLIAAVIGLGLSLGVWWPLVQGGGLVGGDVYPYFLPQKIALAESFANGEIPLWHNRTGLGYPLLAESQAGVFYPPNQILYRWFDVNTAYNANVLLHYWMAFVFAWRFARCQGVALWPAMLTALVFVYGWFPARISWEWSIFGGLFFPLSLWLTDRLVQKPSAGRTIALAACFAVFLLSGHFTLAFISQLTAITYAVLRIRGGVALPENGSSQRRTPFLVIAAVGGSMLLAAVQIVPTFELKQLSQRTGTGDAFDPAFGHMPPAYATQVVASWWYWHHPDVIKMQSMRTSPFAISADTNVVEAHLYWGLLPLGLMLLLLKPSIRNKVRAGQCWLWLILIVAAAIYATGWLMPLTRHLPGFGFFNGPGRYTIVCALGGAILAGHALTAMLSNIRGIKVPLAVVIVCCLTLPDLLWSSQYTAHARAVPVSPLAKIDSSWIRTNLATQGEFNCRLLAPGPNVGNLFGVSCVPQYLGLGPAVYYDKERWPATGPSPVDSEFPSAVDLRKLETLAITHLLTTDPLVKPSPRIELVSQLPDRLLNSMWGRGGQPCFLYRLTESPQRIVSQPESALKSWQPISMTANTVRFEVDLRENADVELRELMYPGWEVTIDGDPVFPNAATMMRTVSVPKGKHSLAWSFRPASFRVGLWISLLSLFLACLLCLPITSTLLSRVWHDPTS